MFIEKYQHKLQYGDLVRVTTKEKKHIKPKDNRKDHVFREWQSLYGMIGKYIRPALFNLDYFRINIEGRIFLLKETEFELHQVNYDTIQAKKEFKNAGNEE